MITLRILRTLVALAVIQWIFLHFSLAATAQDSACPTTDVIKAAPTAPFDFGWKKSHGSVALLNHGIPVWRFNYAPELSKPYFHPVSIAGGPLMTVDRPKSHPWHHGMWFSWESLNGINYWEENPSTQQCEGRTTCSNVQLETRSDFSARLSLDLEFVDTSDETVMSGLQVVEISAPSAVGEYHFDWTLLFKAGEKSVEIGRTPILGEPNGHNWGGYGGLSVRLPELIHDAQASTAEHAIEFVSERFRGKSVALEFNGLVEKELAGVAICNHPSNPQHPVSWYLDAQTRPMNYVSPAVVFDAPIKLSAGETLSLRYRVLFHRQRWPASRLKRESEAFCLGANQSQKSSSGGQK